MQTRPKTFADKIIQTLDLFPCDLLFIHRDAEKEPYGVRKKEIVDAVDVVRKTRVLVPEAVCVVPVRMMEAWLLISETAIRIAADRSRGTTKLRMPGIKQLDKLPDPKKSLHDALRTASEMSGHRLRRLHVHERVHRVSELIEDFSPLMGVPAFQSLYEDLQTIVNSNGWNR